MAHERKYKSAGATHTVMTPVEFLARLAALVPPPRHPVLLYRGAFAAHHAGRQRRV